MPMLLRVLSTETLKLKRTLALGMVVIAPALVMVLYFLIALFAPAGAMARGGRDPWDQLASNTVGLWSLLMMPMFVTLETSLLAGLEHADRNWKGLLTLPAPRWTIYISKLIVTVALLWSALAVLTGGTLASAAMLRALRADIGLHALPIDRIAGPLARVSIAALFGLAIQHWVSLRWQSFTAAFGFGMCAMVVGFVAVNSPDFGPWVPWSMPLHAIRAANNPAPMILPIALAGAFVVAIAGAWEFSRREIA